MMTLANALDVEAPPEGASAPAVAQAAVIDGRQNGCGSEGENAGTGCAPSEAFQPTPPETSAERLRRWGFTGWALPSVERYEPHPTDARVTWARHQLAAAVAVEGCTLSPKAYALAAQVDVTLPGRAPAPAPAPLERGRLTPTLVASRLRPALKVARAALRGRGAVESARASLVEALRQAAALPRGIGPKYAALALDARHALTSLDARLACLEGGAS